MTAYARPAWMVPSAFSATLVPQVRTFASPYGGAGQALDLLGEKWRFELTLPPVFKAAAAAREAFLHRLMGGAHTVGLHHFGRPYPMGTARGTITLASGAAAGAASLSLTGVRPGSSLMPHGGFSADTNGDGVSDGWASYTTGSFGVASFDRIDGYQRIFATLLGSTIDDRCGLSGPVVAATAAHPYTFAAEIASNAGGHKAWLYMAFLDGASVYLGEAFAEVDITSAWVRHSVTGTAPAGTAFVHPLVWMTKGAADLRALWVRRAHLERSAYASAYAGPPTLLAGDVLGLGGQLLMVAEDVTLTDAGTGTVQLVNRVRAARSSGAAVTWARPTAEFALLDAPGVPAGYGIGATAPGLSLTFEERWS